MQKRIVIADDDWELVQLLARQCRKLGLRVEEATDGFEASTSIFLRRENSNPPDLVILDISMPEPDGFTICEELLFDERTKNVAIIVLTGRWDRATIRRCEELGVHYVPKTDRIWSDLRPLLVDLLELKDEGDAPALPAVSQQGFCDLKPKPKVLCVDDDHLFTKVLQKRLSAQGIDVLRAFSGLQGFWMAMQDRPDLIVTDYSMKEGGGVFLLRRLRDYSATQGIPVIVVSGCDLEERGVDGFDCSVEQHLYHLGAVRVLCKPVDHQALIDEMIRQLARSTDTAPALTHSVMSAGVEPALDAEQSPDRFTTEDSTQRFVPLVSSSESHAGSCFLQAPGH